MISLTWVLAFFALFFATLYFLKRYGMIDSLEFVQRRLPESLFLYVENIGPYLNLGPVFHNLYKNCLPNFPGGVEAGIYYDAPSAVVDTDRCRASCGLLLNLDQHEQAQRWVRDHPIYKLKKLPEVEVISTSIPNHGMLSYFLAPRRAYAQLNHWAKQMGIERPCGSSSAIEIYHFDGKNDRVEYAFPHGQNADGYYITSIPRPEYKKSKDD